MQRETYTRSLCKAISWRVLATLTTVGLIWLITGQPTAAVAVGAVEWVAKIVLYLLHERMWNRITLGRMLVSPAVGRAPSSKASEPGKSIVFQGLETRA